MPTYVYECSACEKVFEVEQRIVEDALKDCDCGGKDTLIRLIQPTAISFKGSGFYVNDSNSATNAAPKSSDSTTKSDVSTGDAAPAASDSAKVE